MRILWNHLRGAVRRVFPETVGQAQAVAFNMFLAFFPLLLLALGVLTSAPVWRGAAAELHRRLLVVLPPGSGRLVVDHLVRQGAAPLPWSLAGGIGTLLVGTQVMAGLLQGVQMVHRERTLGWWRMQARASGLLLLCIGPWMTAVVFTVFGRQVRGWMIRQWGLPGLFHGVWLIIYVGLVLVLAVLVLAVIYRGGRPSCRGWNEVVPGAILATLLWWVVNASFGFYVRHVPYSRLYGGLAAVIGLMVWMHLSALVVFLGAAYNAEAAASRHPCDRPAPGLPPHGPSGPAPGNPPDDPRADRPSPA